MAEGSVMRELVLSRLRAVIALAVMFLIVHRLRLQMTKLPLTSQSMLSLPRRCELAKSWKTSVSGLKPLRCTKRR